MGAFFAVAGIALVIALAAWVASISARQQRRMRGESDDTRRADDGGDRGFTDYGSPMG